LLAKGLGPHAEGQFRVLSYESYDPYSGAMGQVNALARIVFRFR
jgi:hypothetical protein